VSSPQVQNIERELEVTRRELDRTLDVLQGRFSVRQRVKEALGPMRARGHEIFERGRDLGRTATAAVRQQPLPYIAAAITVVAFFTVRRYIIGSSGWPVSQRAGAGLRRAARGSRGHCLCAARSSRGCFKRGPQIPAP
jgi:hypothetical protein